MKQGFTYKIAGLAFGIGFGFVLAAANLHEYQVIHDMLSLRELDVFWLMGAAIATSLPILWVVERKKLKTLIGGQLSLSRSRISRNNIVGGAIFGIGWALSGTCPAPALIMLASGAGLAAVTITGLFLGLGLRDFQTTRSAQGATIGDGEHRQ